MVEELECDAEVRLGDLTEEFLAALEQMGPFGNGNAEPVLISRGVRLSAALKVIKERHLRVTVEDVRTAQSFGGMAWSRRTDWAAMAQEGGWTRGDLMDLAYRLRQELAPEVWWVGVGDCGNPTGGAHGAHDAGVICRGYFQSQNF